MLERMLKGGSIGNKRWDDERIPIGGMVLGGVNDPTIATFIGAISTLLFAPGALNEIFLTIQLPHRYAEGTDIVPHVHWAPVNTNTGNVRWGFEYAWENVDDQFSAPTTTLEISDAGDGVVGGHQVATLGTIVGTGKLISSMLCARLYRDGADVLDTYTGNAAMLEFDIHYQVDARGSRQEFVK